MFEQRLLDTKRNLQKLAIQSGKSLQDILKCLTESQNSFEGMFNQESINPNEKEEELDLSHLKQTRKGVFEQQMEKNGQGRICLERVMQLIEESILDLNKALTMIMENIVDQMVTKKIYKIRQNFRNLVLNIFGMEEFSFYAFFQSNRIQFQDFSSNFITQIMESDEKYQLLQKIIKSFNHTFEFISLAQNSQMSKLFGLNSNHEKQKYYGIVTHGSPQQEMKASYCLMIKTNNKQTINCVLMKRLINKIIEIAQINTSEESIYITSKIYAKKMLDFLQIIIIQYQSRLKKSLSEYCSLKKQLCFSLSNIIKIILSKVDQNLGNEQPVLALKKLTNQFQEMHYKKIEEIRIYKKYVRENDSILLQFNRVGILQFISGNIDNEYLNNLTSIWEEGKPVLDLLLGKNQKFDSYVKKSLRGTFKTERPIQISDNLKTKITTNGKRIIKISIIIENKQFQKKKEQQNKQNQRANLNDNSNLLKQIQQQNPGVTKQGWLDLFLKNQNHKRGSLETRKSNTYSTPSNSTDLKFKKKSSLVDFKDQFKINLNDIIIDDPTLNILTFNEIQLEEFVIKVLDSLDYFQRLPQQRQKLKSFIRELHDGYQIHSNPFHNFSHGVNVMHMCYLLSSLPANVNILSAKDVFINVFSGLCHDVGHTGFTNAFEIASRSRKAMIYNDKSPLQNFHASMTFQILRKNENNFLCHMDRQQFAKFRKAVIENILYTDIKEHFFLLNSFNDLLKSGKVLGQEDAPILSYMIVHSSDFSGSVREFELCRQWSRRVNMEFSNQYKVQGQLGLPQTPFMKDLDNPLVTSKAEGGFLKVIVYPLYQSLDNLYVSEGIVHKLKKNIQNNIKNWQQINKKQTEKAKALKQVELQTKQ